MSDIVERLRETVAFSAHGKRHKRFRNPGGPAAADEIEALRAEVEGLRGVLTHLEMANEALAAKRSRETYLAMEAEARDELIMLDEARRNARAALTQTKDTTDDA